MAGDNQAYFVPKIEEPFRYHAFLAHCEDDLRFARELLRKIEQHGFLCLFAKRDFIPGAAIVDNISTAIHRSRRTLLVISKASLRSSWCKYEMLAVVDESNRSNRISFMPVIMTDVEEEKLPNTLRFVDYVLEKDKFYLEKILTFLAAPDKDWETMIPAGNVAHGLAWSYYYGYLRLVLPDIDKRIQKSHVWKDNPRQRRICQKLLLLFPASCCCRDTLTQDDSRIKHAGHLETIRKNRAGTVGREYRSTIYSLAAKSGEMYYFVGEYVTSVHVMYEMEQSGFAGLKTNDKTLQATRFLITIKDILSRDKECTHRYKFIFYKDDENTDISELLVDVIKEEIKKENKYTERQFSMPSHASDTNIKRTIQKRSISDNSSDTSQQNVGCQQHQSKEVVSLDRPRTETVQNEHGGVVLLSKSHRTGQYAEVVENESGNIAYIRQGNEFHNVL